jgi:deoxycytidine triphosphate deaminase
MGMLLRDRDIEELLRSPKSIIAGFDVSRIGADSSPVKGASLNLTIGDIFVPGITRDDVGGLNKPREKLSLESGQTAVIRSAELLRMPKDVAGVGFPPSSKVSLAGLLSTNPGHVDPDYNGHLHLTVVNMGKEAFHLNKGETFMRLMLFKLDQSVAKPLGTLASPLTEELLGRLSHNFLDIDDRALKVAKTEELKLRSWQVWATIVTAILTGTIALGYQYLSSQRELSAQIARIEGRISALGGTLSVGSFDDQVRKVGALEERLKLLEASKK